jgi:hypothetical protein
VSGNSLRHSPGPAPVGLAAGFAKARAQPCNPPETPFERLLSADAASNANVSEGLETYMKTFIHAASTTAIAILLTGSGCFRFAR